jgi:adenosylcobinamide-GDP ribazoletransferase
VRSLLAAIAFLTRIPVAKSIAFDANDVAQSAGWFPLVGVLLGGAYVSVAALLKPHLPLAVIAVLLIAIDALVTGALHFDGIADTADGFGGGKDRDDVLRIMRDHAIGSYGGLALVLLVALKCVAYYAVLGSANWIVALVVIPTLGRWSILLLSAIVPYARPGTSVVASMENSSLIWGSFIVIVVLATSLTIRPWVAAGVVAAVTILWGSYCRRKIDGITGDTLGANLQLCECAALLTFLWAR